MEKSMFLTCINVFGLVLLPFALNRLRYTVPITGKITDVGSRNSYSESAESGARGMGCREYYIFFEYCPNGTPLSKQIGITKRSYSCFRRGQSIKLKMLANNPYKVIIEKDPNFFSVKFLLTSVVVIDIYSYLQFMGLTEYIDNAFYNFLYML